MPTYVWRMVRGRTTGGVASVTKTSEWYAPATEGDRLRTASRVIADCQGRRAQAARCRLKRHADAATRSRRQRAAACVGLAEILWIGSSNGNPGDAQAVRAHVGQSHSLRRTGCANRDG